MSKQISAARVTAEGGRADIVMHIATRLRDDGYCLELGLLKTRATAEVELHCWPRRV